MKNEPNYYLKYVMLLDIAVIRAEVKIRSLVEIKFTGTSKRKWHTRRHKTTRFEKVMPRATKWWIPLGFGSFFLLLRTPTGLCLLYPVLRGMGIHSYTMSVPDCPNF